MNTYDTFVTIENTALCLRYDGKHQYRDSKNYCRISAEPNDDGELVVTECTNQGLIGRKLLPDSGAQWVEE